MNGWPRHLTLIAALAVSCLGLIVSLEAAGARQNPPAEAHDPQAAVENATSISNVDVFFATNRRREQIDKPGVRLGGERGDPLSGICRAEFKSIPMLGEIAGKMPFYVPTESADLRLELQDDPEMFWERLTQAVDATALQDVVVFIHGYSYDFERSCGRAAEAQRVLEGQSTVVLFTWPSDGDATGYVSDQTDLDWSVPFLQEVLSQLVERFGRGHVHVLAHSMGSRGVVQALERWKLESDQAPLIGRLVLLAPDLDTQIFVERLPGLLPLAESITLYASGTDTPLKFSHQLNGSPRLGQAGDYLTVADGMETIDVTPAGRYQYLGHEYFYFHPRVGADLVELVTTGRGAAERSGLRPRQPGEQVYWEVIPERDN